MYPTIEIFGKTIGTYTLLALIGGLLAGFFSMRTAKKRGYDDNDMLVTVLWGALGALIGGHLLYGVTNSQYIYLLFSAASFEEFINNAVTIFGGSVFYGGLLGGLIAGYIYMSKKKLDIGGFSDIAAPTISLFHCFGRIGCFLGGCCYGIESEFGFTFEHALIEQANGVNRFPVQLLEASFNLALFFVLWQLLRKNKLKNHLLSVYLVVYPIGRFCFEFLRGDEYRGFLFGLSTSQIISILLIIGTVIIELYRKFFKKDSMENKTE